MKQIILFLLLLSFVSDAQYVWKRIDSPEGGCAGALYQKGDTMLVGVNSTIYFSTNKGVSWQKSSINNAMGFSGFTHTKDSVFYVIGGNSLYKSQDLINWQITWTYPYCNFYSIASDKFGNIYLANQWDVYRLKNNETNWVKIFTIPDSYFPSLLITEKHVFVTAKSFIYRKQLEGIEGWVQISMPRLTFNPITLVNNKEVLYAISEYNHYLITSTNDGDSWSEIDLALFFPTIKPTTIAVSNNTLLLGDDVWDDPQGITLYRSDAFGTKWEPVVKGLPPRIQIQRIIPCGDDFLLSTYGYGILKSTDKGESWFPANKNINEMKIHNFVKINDHTLFISTWGAGIMRSTDSGTSWEEVNYGIEHYICGQVVKNSSNILYAASNMGLYRSSDLGSKWTKLHTVNNDHPYSVFIDPCDRLYVTVYNGIFRTTNDGITWQMYLSCVYPNGVAFNKYGEGFASDANDHLFKTTNDGVTWTIVHDGVYFGKPLIAENGNIFIPSHDYLYKSSDDGITWKNINSGIIYPHLWRVLTDNQGNYFTSSYYTTNQLPALFYSSDEGENWHSITGNLEMTTIWDMLFLEDKILLATDGGIWMIKSSMKDIMSAADGSSPRQFSLYQNYPNPFNPVTKIKYDIAVEGNVRIDVYSITGERVTTLVNQYMKTGGYVTQFNGEGFPSGIYLYRITSSSGSISRKMIYLK